MQLEVAVEIQRAYRKLTSGEVPFTKKNMCALLVPLRDKYRFCQLREMSYPLKSSCFCNTSTKTGGNYYGRFRISEGMQKNVRVVRDLQGLST